MLKHQKSTMQGLANRSREIATCTCVMIGRASARRIILCRQIDLTPVDLTRAQNTSHKTRPAFSGFVLLVSSGSLAPKMKDTRLKSHQTINQMQGNAGMCSLLGLVGDGSNGRRRKLPWWGRQERWSVIPCAGRPQRKQADATVGSVHSEC